MRWGFCLGVTIIVLLIIRFEWRILRTKPRRDKAAFTVLLLVVWFLSMMDLLYTPGPTHVLTVLFRPFRGFVEQ